ncbi:MAG TPA: Rieske (2Fe-2S) protein [Alphaproteobacteria bacterium]
MTGESLATLPVGWLIDPDAFMRERRTVFADAWQMIACAETLSAPGDYVCHNLAGLAAVAMRSETGEILVFRNACRHQKLPILDAGAGKCALLRCRYHGWTYRFDGAFKEAPAQYAPADKASAENNLPRLPLVNWRGLIFVGPECEAAEFAAEMKPIETAIDRIVAKPLNRIGEIVTDFQCNWKVPIEHWLARNAAGQGPCDGFHWLYRFPTLMLQASADSLIAHQLVVRSFDRTRVASHIFAQDAASVAGLLDRLEAMLAEDKRICDLRHAEMVENGAARAACAPSGSALADFRARIRSAHKRAEALS